MLGPIMIMPVLPAIPVLGGGQGASNGKIMIIGFNEAGNISIANIDINLNDPIFNG